MTSRKWLREWVIIAKNFSHSKAGRELGDWFSSLHTGTRRHIKYYTPRHFLELADMTQDPGFCKFSWRRCRIPEITGDGIGHLCWSDWIPEYKLFTNSREENNGCNKPPSGGNFLKMKSIGLWRLHFLFTGNRRNKKKISFRLEISYLGSYVF